MDLFRRTFYIAVCGASILCATTACTTADNANSHTTATTNVAPPTTTSSPMTQTLVVVDRPQTIKDQMAARGEQDEARPVLRIVAPREGETINGSTVNVKLDLGGDLKGYKPMKDPATGMGNHIHVILDNQPYEAYYDLNQPFELRNVAPGEHTLRVFASRPWHESYKTEGNFQMVRFTVEGGGDQAKRTTTASGQPMADPNKNNQRNANLNAPAQSPTPAAREGKDMAASNAGNVDPKRPLLTYSRPKGEYKGADAIMIDFWLANAKLAGDGGEYRVRYSIDNGEPQYIDRWAPIWLSGWTSGKHSIKLELVDKNGQVVDNGGYNSTTREITVTK